MKKTKIVATMSDFRCTEEFVKQLFDAGMDVVRVNSAHVSEDGATHIVETVHRVNPAIPIMIDTKGPEIRVTTIADEYGNSINFRPGDRVAVRGSDGSDFTTRKVVYMNVPSIVSDIPVGARMLIADGELEIRVVGKNDTELDCEFVVGGAMRSRKSVNVPGVSIDLPSVTEKDRRFASEINTMLLERAARIAAACLCAILRERGFGAGTLTGICADGTMLKLNPVLRPRMEALIAEFTKRHGLGGAEFLFAGDATLLGCAWAALA